MGAGLISVDPAVVFLISEGYRAIEQRPKLQTYQDGMELITRTGTLHHNFRVALLLAKTFGIEKEALDSVVNGYLAKSKEKGRGPAHSLFKRVAVGMLRREIELPGASVIIEFARLGASTETREYLLAEFVERGKYDEAATMAEMIGRQLTKSEIVKLVEAYNEGGSQCGSTKTTLKSLAAQSLTARGAEEIASMIDESRREFDSRVDPLIRSRPRRPRGLRFCF